MEVSTMNSDEQVDQSTGQPIDKDNLQSQTIEIMNSPYINNLAKKESISPTNYNNVHNKVQQQLPEIIDDESKMIFPETSVNNNSNVEHVVDRAKTTFSEPDCELKASVQITLMTLIEKVVESLQRQAEEKEQSQQQQQQPQRLENIASKQNYVTDLQNNLEQSNQDSNESSNSTDNVAEQYNQPALSPDEVTSDLVIDAGDQLEETPVRIEEKSTDDDNDSTAETEQKQQSHVEFVKNKEKYDPIATDNKSAAATTINKTTSVDGNKVDSINCSSPVKFEVNPSENSKLIAVISQGLDSELEEGRVRDIVLLRNLDIASPLPQTAQVTSNEIAMEIKPKEDEACGSIESNRSGIKRKRSVSTSNSTAEQNESSESGERQAKRIRTQTKLFQAGEAISLKDKSKGPVANSSIRSRKDTKSTSRNRKKSTASSSTTSESANLSISQESIINQPQFTEDVIFYEKNDYLAIRNEADGFYLAQSTGNVKKNRPYIRIRWLDTEDEQMYVLTKHYDTIPQKSIIMPVTLNKLKSEKKGEQLFSLDNQAKDAIMERLKRSLLAPSEHS